MVVRLDVVLSANRHTSEIPWVRVHRVHHLYIKLETT